MADLIVPGVWWLHDTRGSNVFALEVADNRFMLVDCGFATSAMGIAAELELIAPGHTLSEILLTHAHIDHSGAAAQLRERFGASVIAGAGDCALDEVRGMVLREPVGRSHRWRRFLNSLARSRSRHECIVDMALSGETELAPGIVAVPTPGHTPGSYCYVDGIHGVAFVGDLVISHKGRLTRPLRAANADDPCYLQALREFALRAPAIGCAGHGEPIMDDFAVALTALAALPRRRVASLTGGPARAFRLLHFARMLMRQRRRGDTGADP